MADPKADFDEGGCVLGATGFSRIVVSTSVEASDRGATKCRSIAASEGGASRPTLTDGSGRCGPPICSVLTSGDLLRAQPLPRRRRRRRREATRDQRLFLRSWLYTGAVRPRLVGRGDAGVRGPAPGHGGATRHRDSSWCVFAEQSGKQSAGGACFSLFLHRLG